MANGVLVAGWWLNDVQMVDINIRILGIEV